MTFFFSFFFVTYFEYTYKKKKKKKKQRYIAVFIDCLDFGKAFRSVSQKIEVGLWTRQVESVWDQNLSELIG